MPSLNITQLKDTLNKVQHVKDRYKGFKYDTFVETGTHMGHTAFEMAQYMKRVDTIEIKKDLYDGCKAVRDQHNIANVNLHLGDSTTVLSKILDTLDKECIFFLDGHYSHGATGKGDKDVPLLEELQQINNKHNYDSIIIIDDARLFGTKMDEDWSDVTLDKIINCFDKGKIYSSFLNEDRYNIFLQKIT
jgi:predicted O-methyltransferase YrrM